MKDKEAVEIESKWNKPYPSWSCGGKESEQPLLRKSPYLDRMTFPFSSSLNFPSPSFSIYLTTRNHPILSSFPLYSRHEERTDPNPVNRHAPDRSLDPIRADYEKEIGELRNKDEDNFDSRDPLPDVKIQWDVDVYLRIFTTEDGKLWIIVK